MDLKGSKTHENLKAAFAGESQANRRYLYFAKAADIEGYPEVAGLFRDTAEGETGHAHGHLDYLKKVYPPEDPKYTNIYVGALPDTLVWRNRLGYNETMTNNYLRHPAYAEYPVVGVNWVQATQFAEWRTDRVNEAMLEREGYLAEAVKYRAMNG